MIKRILAVAAVAAAALGMTGCESVDINASSTQTAYLYQKDINDSQRYNSGSDYVFHLPFEADYKVLYMDYSRSTTPVKATYTLKTEEKISIDVQATVIFELLRNPADTNLTMPYKDDKYVQFFTQRVKPQEQGTNHFIYPNMAYSVLMKDVENKAFREAFTNSDYKSFEDIEDNIEKIKQDILDRMIAGGKDNNVKVVGVVINDIPVPPSIKEAREEALKLTQDEANQTKQINMALRLQASQQVKRVRAALNDIYIDRMYANNVNPTYMLIETMKVAAENKGLSMSLTPSFMEYVDKNHQASRDKLTQEDRDLLKNLSEMSNEDLEKMFTR